MLLFGCTTPLVTVTSGALSASRVVGGNVVCDISEVAESTEWPFWSWLGNACSVLSRGRSAGLSNGRLLVGATNLNSLCECAPPLFVDLLGSIG